MNLDHILPPKENLKHRWTAIVVIHLTDDEAAHASAGHNTVTSADKLASGPVSCVDCHLPYDVAIHTECQP